VSERRAFALTSSLLVLTASTTLLSACPQLMTSEAETTRVVVSLRAAEAEAVGKAVVVVEGAVARVEGVRRVRSVGCASGGVVVVERDARHTEPVTAIHDALTARAAALPVGISPLKVTGLGHDVRLLSVRGADPFVARAFVDTQLLAALQAVPGVSEVVVSGGRREQQLRIDPERLLAADISLPEVLTAIRTASDLDKTVIKMSSDGARILLRDVSVTETGSVGEPVRKDGGVEVRVRGSASSVGAVDDVIAAATAPPGLFVAVLDDDSVEVVTVLVSRNGDQLQQQGDPVVAAAADSAVDAAFADVAAAALGIPGIHTFRRGRSLQLTLDRKRLDALGLSTSERAALSDVTAIATSGLELASPRGPLRVLLGTAATPEALLSTRVATRRVGADKVPVRLFDVARAAFVEEQRAERVDLKPARRLRLSFDAGVRKPALADLDTRLAAIRHARPGISILVERDDDTAPLDAICP